MSDPPPSSRFRVSPAARATWGDVCSPARRISSSEESGCLYETCYFYLGSGSFCAPYQCPVPSDGGNLPWEFMGSNRIFWEMRGNSLVFLITCGSHKRHVVSKYRSIGQFTLYIVFGSLRANPCGILPFQCGELEI